MIRAVKVTNKNVRYRVLLILIQVCDSCCFDLIASDCDPSIGWFTGTAVRLYTFATQ